MDKNYLFAEIARRVAECGYPDLIRLGIGDVTLPLPPAAVAAMKQAADEMGTPEGFRGYPPYEGYGFLREDIAAHDYNGIVAPDEIFISDGAKSDSAAFAEILGLDNSVAVCDPVYPVYVDSNIIAGRSGFTYLPCTPANGFVPPPPDAHIDIVYLCYPNNPTGAAATKAQLKDWVDWANGRGSLLLFDGAYTAFITEAGIPRSIYEIDGARTCAVEFRSFSKSAGFTGTRCAYTVVPRELKAGGHSLRELWMRRQSTKFNGVSYITQRGAQAVFTPEGKKQVAERVGFYLNNAAVIFNGLKALGFEVYGAVNSPYVWLKTDLPSWEFFDKLLHKARVVGTPGAGFGKAGEGYFRLTGFGTLEDTKEAINRIEVVL